MWHSRQAFTTTFPHVSLFTKVMLVLRRSLHTVVSDGHVFGLFVPLPPTVFRNSPGNKLFVVRGCRPNFVSQCCVYHVHLMVPKHPDSCSNFHKADESSRALSSRFVLGSNCAGSFPGPYTHCGIRFPCEKPDVRWRCFPVCSALLPIRRALCP